MEEVCEVTNCANLGTVTLILSWRLTSPKQKALGKFWGTWCTFWSICGRKFLYLARNYLNIIIFASNQFAIKYVAKYCTWRNMVLCSTHVCRVVSWSVCRSPTTSAAYNFRALSSIASIDFNETYYTYRHKCADDSYHPVSQWVKVIFGLVPTRGISVLQTHLIF